MSVEQRLTDLEALTAGWARSVTMRQHRDSWRRYAYTGKNKPSDSVGQDDTLGKTIIETLQYQLEKSNEMIETFIRREHSVMGSPESPFQTDKVLLDKAEAIIKANEGYLWA